MGRPLKKQYFGNVTANGQTIVGNAWVAGDTVARPCWIYKQLSSNSFYWFSVDGTGPATGGQAYLVNGEVTGPGQANISLYPYGAQGGGATGTANLGVNGGTVIVSGTGAVTADYGVGNVLSVSGGTYTGNQQANVTVASVKVRTIAAAVGGSNYTVGDTFTFSTAGFSTNAVITVTAADGTGAVTGVSITNAGIYTGASLPADPVLPSSNVITNASAAGATFNIGWGLNTFTIANAGDYTALPANPVTLTGAGGGATANLVYQVSSVLVTNGGSGFDSGTGAQATFTPSNGATATGTTNVAGSVTSVTVTGAGTGFTAIPTVAITPAASASSAAQIFDNTVTNYTGQNYKWLTQGNTLPDPTWAHLNTE